MRGIWSSHICCYYFKENIFNILNNNVNAQNIIPLTVSSFLIYSDYDIEIDNELGATSSLTGDSLNDIFNISETGLDPIDIIKLYL